MSPCAAGQLSDRVGAAPMEETHPCGCTYSFMNVSCMNLKVVHQEKSRKYFDMTSHDSLIHLAVRNLSYLVMPRYINEPF